MPLRRRARNRPQARKNTRRKTRRTAPPKKKVVKAWRPTKEVSVMAWVEDAFGHVLMVKQARGKKLWTLPGGKTKPRESLLSALKREIYEETGLNMSTAAPVDIYDRPKKSGVTILFRVLLKRSPLRPHRSREISTLAFRKEIPANSTPSAHYFWDRAQESFEPLSLLR
jgi:8-oxo-dGTP pyrophosphatase MutT (NUDIX family)